MQNIFTKPNAPYLTTGTLAAITLLASGVLAAAPYIGFLAPVVALNLGIPFIIGCALFSVVVMALSYSVIAKNNEIESKEDINAELKREKSKLAAENVELKGEKEKLVEENTKLKEETNASANEIASETKSLQEALVHLKAGIESVEGEETKTQLTEKAKAFDIPLTNLTNTSTKLVGLTTQIQPS